MVVLHTNTRLHTQTTPQYLEMFFVTYGLSCMLSLYVGIHNCEHKLTVCMLWNSGLNQEKQENGCQLKMSLTLDEPQHCTVHHSKERRMYLRKLGPDYNRSVIWLVSVKYWLEASLSPVPWQCSTKHIPFHAWVPQPLYCMNLSYLVFYSKGKIVYISYFYHLSDVIYNSNSLAACVAGFYKGTKVNKVRQISFKVSKF